MAESISIKKAAIINAAGRYSKVVLALLVNAILARILSAADFGVIAVVTVFTTLFTSLADMGFGTAIVQRKDLSKRQVDDIFTFTVYISGLLALAFSLCGVPISTFFGDECYIPLCRLLSVSLFFSSLNMVPNGIMNREKRFKSLALRTVSVYGISSAVAIALALCGAGYYSLAWQSLVSAFATFVWNAASTRTRFTLKFDWSSVTTVLSYSGFQFAFNLVTYLSDNVANLVTGKLFGSVKLGFYSRAATLTTYPTTSLAGVITPVLHPILSDYADDKERIYSAFLRVSKLLAYLGLMVGSVCFLAADEVVLIMYGDGWGQSAECLRWLSLVIMPSMMNASVGGIFQSLGDTRMLFLNSCINTVVTFLAILFGAVSGGDIVTLSKCVGLSRGFHLLSAHYMLVRLCFEYPLKPFAREYRGVFMALVLHVLAIAAWTITGIEVPGQVLSLAVKGALLVLLTFVSIVICDDSRLFSMLLRRS